mgnify:FL=1
MNTTIAGLFSKQPIINYQQASSIQTIKKNYLNMKNKLQIINSLKSNDKLGCDVSNNYYIDAYRWGQFISRRWFNQSREKTSIDLKRDFEVLMKIFDKYLEYINMKDKGLLIALLDGQQKLTKDMLDFVTNIVKGLYNLKQSYPGKSEIKCRIDSIIITLCDFKDKLEELPDAFENRSNSILRLRALSQ